MYSIIATDISGRHKLGNDKYYMVCAAVCIDIEPDGIYKVNEIATKAFYTDKAPDILSVVRMVESTAEAIKNKDAVIVIEQGDLFNISEKESKVLFFRDVKFQESIGERRAVEIAHHVSLSSRRLLIREWEKRTKEEKQKNKK